MLGLSWLAGCFLAWVVLLVVDFNFLVWRGFLGWSVFGLFGFGRFF